MEEDGRDFLSNVSLGFKALCANKKWKKISAMKPEEEIISEIKLEIKKLLNNEKNG